MQQKYRFLLRIFATVLISTLFITAFSHLGPQAYERVFQEDDIYSNGTFVGPVKVEGLQQQEAVGKIKEAVANWQKKNVISLSFADKSVQFPSKMFYFEAEDSVASTVPGISNPLFLLVKEQDIKEQVASLVDNDTILSFVNIPGLKAKLEELASMLPEKETSLKLTDYMDEEFVNKKEILSHTDVSMAGSEQLSNWLESHGEIIIPARSNFSLLSTVKDENFHNDFLSKISSAIYETILSTNLEIVERHISKEFPDGYELGFEAKIMKDDMDLILYNPNDTDIMLQFRKKTNNALTITALGMRNGSTYKIRVEEDKESPYEPKKIIQYTATPSNVKATKGKKGYSASVYRDIYDAHGAFLKTTLVSEDFYLPVNEVVVKEIGSTESVENEDEVTEDNDETNPNDELNKAMEELESLKDMIDELEELGSGENK